MVLSRKIFQRVRNYCIFRVAGTIQLIFFFFVAVNYRPLDYFEGLDLSIDHVYLPVIAIVLITLLNDACVLTIARDNVVPSQRPQQWDMREIFAVSSVLGFVACLGSVLLLVAGLHAGQKARSETWACFFFSGAEHVRIGGEERCEVRYPQLLTMIYLKLSLTDFITVFAARTRRMFFSRRPGYALLGAFFVATGATTFIASNAQFHGMEPISMPLVGMVWAYALAWFVAQDVAKAATYAAIDWWRGKPQQCPCAFDAAPSLASHAVPGGVSGPQRAASARPVGEGESKYAPVPNTSYR
jgi:H+-transporting ATPase